jgi:ABC-type glycerol-3-phosphate transport system substrate-binding protein
MIGESSVIAEWYRANLIIDLNPFLTDPVVGLTDNDRRDFYTGIFREFVLDGSVRPGMPFSQSIQVIYYNKSWAEELEFTSLPSSADDFREQSCISAENGESAGVILSPQAANVLSFIYAYGGDPMISIGGDYHFSSRQITEFAENWADLVRDGCGQLISNYPNPMAIEGEYERFNQRKALMIMGSSLMLEHIQPGAEQKGPTDIWQMVAFRGPDGSRAVASEVQSVVIFDSTPETELAAWLFLKYLTSPEVQAEWAEYSGYYPTRQDSLPFLQQHRKDNPYWASGVNLLAYSRSVPLHPSWQIVQLALEDAFEELLADPEIDPSDQLEELDRIATELLDRSRE